MLPLTQIAYLPQRARGNLKHPSVEFGFVVSRRGYACRCRFWQKDQPGILETTLQDYPVLDENLVVFQSVPQFVVEQTVKNYGIPVG